MAVWAAMRAVDDVAVAAVKRGSMWPWRPLWPCGSWNVAGRAAVMVMSCADVVAVLAVKRGSMRAVAV